MNNVELAVIGCILQKQDTAAAVFDVLRPDDFLSMDLSALYSDIRHAWQQKGAVDAVTACSLWPERKTLIVQACEMPVSYSRADTYAKAVKDGAALRAVQAAGLAIAASKDMDEVSKHAETIARTMQSGVPCKATSMKDGVLDFLARQQRGEQPKRFLTGFSRLDNNADITPGDYVVIGGRPSSGKTAFSLQVALNMARSGNHVVYFSLETRTEKVIDRAVSCWTGIPLADIKRTKIDWTSDAAAYSTRALDEMIGFGFDVVQAAGKPVSWIRGEAVRRNAQIAVIDYLGLLQGDGKSRYEIVTNISLALHTWAQQTGQTVIALSQLNRGAATDAPTMADLRESGQVEQDADLILLLHPDKTTFKVHVAKNKEGICGPIPFEFNGARQRFYQLDERGQMT